MRKILISILIAFGLGFASSRLFSNKVVINPDQNLATAKCDDLTSAKTDLISLSKKDYIEYTQIKDLKKKYEKADELLGKVMLLFLADVGFRAQKTVPFESLVPTAEVKPLPIAAESNTPVASPEKKPATNLAGRSSTIKNLGTEKQIQDALDRAIIEDPKLEVAKGGAIIRRQARRLEGRYTGLIKFLDGKRENLSVVWDLIPDYSKSGFSGVFNLGIHGPSQNSESNGRGDIDNIVSLAEDQNGFLVSACGDRCYLQLYYNSRSDQFYGNYYEVIKGAQSKSARLGIVELRK